MSRYPLAVSSWDDEELQAIQRVIDSGMFSMGENVARFEDEFARFAGARYCVMVNSGSSANLLMIAALFYSGDRGLERGDEVLVPAVSWSTSYFPLHQYGLHIRFVDIDPDTLNVSIEKLADAVTDKTRAILAVNLLGNPNDFDAIRDIIGERDITLLEDNCESLGAKYNGKQAGTFGKMGTYSAFFSHHISTMEGGMIVTDDERLYHTLLSLRAHGWTRNLPKVNHVCGTKSDDPFYESYRFVLPGYNLRPLEMSGAIGIEQIRKLPAFIENRRSNAARFRERCGMLKDFRLQQEIGESSWFGFSLVIAPDSPLERKDVLAALDAAGIDVRPIVSGNFANSEATRWLDFSVGGNLENADYIDERGFMVGNHHYALDDEIELLAATLEKLSKSSAGSG